MRGNQGANSVAITICMSRPTFKAAVESHKRPMFFHSKTPKGRRLKLFLQSRRVRHGSSTQLQWNPRPWLEASSNLSSGDGGWSGPFEPHSMGPQIQTDTPLAFHTKVCWPFPASATKVPRALAPGTLKNELRPSTLPIFRSKFTSAQLFFQRLAS